MMNILHHIRRFIMCVCHIFVIVSDFSTVNLKDVKYTTTSITFILQDHSGINHFEDAILVIQCILCKSFRHFKSTLHVMMYG